MLTPVKKWKCTSKQWCMVLYTYELTLILKSAQTAIASITVQLQKSMKELGLFVVTRAFVVRTLLMAGIFPSFLFFVFIKLCTAGDRRPHPQPPILLSCGDQLCPTNNWCLVLVTSIEKPENAWKAKYKCIGDINHELHERCKVSDTVAKCLCTTCQLDNGYVQLINEEKKNNAPIVNITLNFHDEVTDSISKSGIDELPSPPPPLIHIPGISESSSTNTVSVAETVTSARSSTAESAPDQPIPDSTVDDDSDSPDESPRNNMYKAIGALVSLSAFVVLLFVLVIWLLQYYRTKRKIPRPCIARLTGTATSSKHSKTEERNTFSTTTHNCENGLSEPSKQQSTTSVIDGSTDTKTTRNVSQKSPSSHAFSEKAA